MPRETTVEIRDNGYDRADGTRWRRIQYLTTFPNGYATSVIYGCDAYTVPRCTDWTGHHCTCPPDATIESYERLEAAVFDPNGSMLPEFEPFFSKSSGVASFITRQEVMELQHAVRDL